MNNKIKIGQKFNSKELSKIINHFQKNYIRKKLLIIISNQTNPAYKDHWKNNIFYYTGIDSTDYKNHNLKKNNVTILLFEVFKTKEFTYSGEVYLAQNPYQIIQSDTNGLKKCLWVFPLALKNFTPIQNILNISKVKDITSELKNNKLNKLQELRDKINALTNDKSGPKETLINQLERRQLIVEYTKLRADGICELCNENAPFFTKNNEPFLEIHHIKPLSQAGEDIIQNTVGLCPNCHRKMHSLSLAKDIKILINVKK